MSQHHSAPRYTVEYTSPDVIRQKFNQSQYPAWIKNRTLVPTIVRDAPVKDPKRRREPLGTRSQFIRYVDRSGQWLVEVHQYLRPDATLGASGNPDPKRLRIGHTIYAI